MKVKVTGKFPGMNDIVAASKKHYACYSKMKRENTELFQLFTKKFSKVEGKATINITWYFKNKRRDPDNMMASQKFILDALVKNGVIVDDTITYIHSINHSFILGSEDSVVIEVLQAEPLPQVSPVSQASLLSETQPEATSQLA